MELLTPVKTFNAPFTLRQLQAPALRTWAAPDAPRLQTVRVALVGADAGTQQAIAHELAGDARTSLVACAHDLHEGLAMPELAAVDVLLVALHLADGSGLDLMVYLKDVRPSAGAIVISESDDEDAALRAFDLGAAGWLELRHWYGSFAIAILNVAQGGAALSPSMARRLMRRPARFAAPEGAVRTTLATLTEREREVLAQVAAGLTSKQIARRLAICGDTVNAHVKSIYRKLQVHSRTQVVRIATEAGYI